MKKLLAVLVSALFATAAFAQTPVQKADVKADVKAEVKAEKAEVKAEKVEVKADAAKK